eukprot:1400082-Pyramimonas_sp.AAC.1
METKAMFVAGAGAPAPSGTSSDAAAAETPASWGPAAAAPLGPVGAQPHEGHRGASAPPLAS